LSGGTYDLTDWAQIAASTSAAWNRSDSKFFDYENIVAGAGIMLHIEF
jgi:hypothetical protein